MYSQTQPARRLLRLAEFCGSYGLSRSSAYNLMAEGKLKSVKVCGRRLILAESAEALLKAGA